VYLARDLTLGRDVALKTLPHLSAGAVPQLEDEARAMGALNHESLATIFGVNVWRRTPILIVEYFPLGTLAQRLSRGPLSTRDATALGIALSRALVYMHARGVLHRDIKPSNIAFTASGSPKLLDFGLARLTAPGLSDDLRITGARQAIVAGTPAYLPPEAFHGDLPGVRFDLWALSVVLMEAATGANPFADAHGSRAARPTRRCTRDLETAAPALNDVLARALHPTSQRRYPTASALLAALEDALTTDRRTN
jgi:serine/threonine protein kinase